MHDRTLSRKHTFYKELQAVMELKRVGVIIYSMRTIQRVALNKKEFEKLGINC